MAAAGGPRFDDAAVVAAVATDQAWADAHTAALLLAINPQGLGGARLRGPADERRDHWLLLLRGACATEAPWQRLPLNTDDDRLLGGLDLGATLQRGTVVAQPGLLERCHGGVLLAAMAERMAPALAARLGATLDTGRVVPLRHVAPVPTATAVAGPGGLARLAVVALDEGLEGGDEAPPPALLDRLGLFINLAQLPRPAPVDAAHATVWAADAAAARQRLPAVQCNDELMLALCEAALALGVPGLRASQQALAAARAHAAWCGRVEVTVEDAAVAARVVLAPRATRLPPPPEAAQEPQEQQEPQEPQDQQDPKAPPPPPPEPDAQTAAADAPSTPPDPNPDAAAETPQDQVLQAALASVPPGLLALLASAVGRAPSGAGGRAGALQASRLRGRPYGSRRGDPRSGARLHLIDTLRAAAPWQLLRRRERDAAVVGENPGAVPTRPAVLVRREDFHISRFRQRRETTTLFVVDASGSAALHRLAEAKGAVELLLADCYVRRDRVALLAFRGTVGAELLLPPTRSLVRAKRCLAAMPGGGGTPLAAALDAARELAQGLARQGGTPLVVVLTDGRANIARDGSPGRDRAQADALVSARLWQGSGLGVLWLDTAQQPQQAAQVLALTMGARYLPLPHADAGQMSKAVIALR